MALDLTKLLALKENTFDVPVSFDDEGNPVIGFKVVGMNSQQARTEIRRQEVTGIKLSSQRGGNQVDGKTEEGANTLQERWDEKQMNLTAACVVGWYGIPGTDGADAALTRENLIEVFVAFPTWREKVAGAIGADANFIKGSSKP